MTGRLASCLVYTTSRALTGRGRPDREALAAGAIHRLHLASCRHAHGPSARPVTFTVWQTLVEYAGELDDYRLCKVCRPEEAPPR